MKTRALKENASIGLKFLWFGWFAFWLGAFLVNPLEDFESVMAMHAVVSFSALPAGIAILFLSLAFWAYGIGFVAVYFGLSDWAQATMAFLITWSASLVLGYYQWFVWLPRGTRWYLKRYWKPHSQTGAE